VREVLATMIRLWGELDGVEKDHQLSFLREIDLGFAWTAHAWARGQRLETLLSPDLTPGDFVRSIKQLIDLLGQIAVAGAAGPGGAGPGGAGPGGAGPGGTASVVATARLAIDALRRGVVAYSSVG
jgi:ATP-dependent RNA helicase HelY